MAISADLPPTEMMYYTYEGNFKLDCDAKVLSCQFIDMDCGGDETAHREVKISLDRTVLHAQGGGQPTDNGSIQILGCGDNGGEKREIVVTKILLDRATGIASHMGKIDNTIAPSSLSSWIGEQVKVSVDADRRQILSECHTAGHVVDMAMARCEMMMPPTKAYHFLDGPYVEYKGKIAAEDRSPLLEKLQKSFQELVESDIATEIHNVPRSEAEAICNNMTGGGGGGGGDYFKIRDTFKEDETVRIVRVAGWPCPCGGTHVKSTGELKSRNWGITGFRCKKGAVRVKYGQDWNTGNDAK
jgi:Ser-tRNA(Ala) deacylase AlaX